MSEHSIDRPVTPPRSRSPFQHPTPKTPERPKRSIDSGKDVSRETADELDWTVFTPIHIDSLSEAEAKKTLKTAMRKVQTLEHDFRQSKLQAAHYRFNYEMLLAGQEERSKRHEVEYHLLNSSQDLLYDKLSRSEEEEQTFRHRHLKAKRKVAELTEDNRRQQLSIEHLKQAMASGSNFGLSPHRSNSQHQMDGGLEVLCDAAGMAQQRDLDQSSGHEISRPQSRGQLLSPVAFEPVPLPHLPSQATKRRRESQDTADSGDHKAQDSQQSSSGRRMTFNSSGTMAPITPKSPKRAKLAPSAMS